MPFVFSIDLSKLWGDELVAGQLYDFGVGWWLLIWAAVILVGNVFCGYAGEFLIIRIRRNITAHIQHQIFKKRNLYKLVVLDKRVDNYEQRLQEDLQMFVDWGHGMIFGSLSKNPTISYILWLGFWALKSSIEGMREDASEESQNTFWTGSCVIAVFAVCVYLLPMNRISELLFLQKWYEGDMRWSHSRVVNYAESIAAYQGERREEEQVDKRFANVYCNMRRLFLFQSLIYGTTSFFGALNGPFMYTILVQGRVGTEALLTLSIYLMNGFRAMISLPNYYTRISLAAAPCHRVAEMVEVLNELEDDASEHDTLEMAKGVDLLRSAPGKDAADKNFQIRAAEGVTFEDSKIHEPLLAPPSKAAAHRRSVFDSDHIQLENMASGPPNSDLLLFENFSLVIKKGESLAIMGPSGCGKSSLLRIIAGLWPVYKGVVRKPSVVGRGGMFFVPQRPYTTEGTLREQITYPHAYGTTTDKGPAAAAASSSSHQDFDIQQALASVELSFLVKRWGLDTPTNWSDLLSGGEMQRLGFARLFYHRPTFAVMDEATSAIDMSLEAKLLRRCVDMGITMVSVLHRPSASLFHDKVLRFDYKTKAWNLETVEESKRTQALKDARTNNDETGEEQMANKAGAAQLQPQNGIGSVFWHRFTYMMSLSFTSYQCAAAKWLYLNLICHAALGLALIYLADFGGLLIDKLIIGQFEDPLVDDYLTTLYLLTIVYFVAGTLMCYSGQTLSLIVRAGVTKEFHRRYFKVYFFLSFLPPFLLVCFFLSFFLTKPKVAYVCNSLDPTVDTMDQRLVQDLAALTDNLQYCMFGGQLFPGILGGSIQALALLGYGFWLSWFATLSIAVVLCFGSIGMVWGGSKIALVIVPVLRMEGKFRFAHARVREYAESVVFYKARF
jgi:ABC-type uncharacterized transport system fused permease/ATPase subunit